MNLRELERRSIREFVQSAADEGYLSGRVLDVGAGHQPYRDIVEAASGTYTPYDAPSFPGNVGTVDTTGDAFGQSFDTVLCTQVTQFVDDVRDFLWRLRIDRLSGNGTLVMTYVTNWPEVEREDLHRHTKTGMTRLLTDAGFSVIRHDLRAHAFISPGPPKHAEPFALGYGVVARVPEPQAAATLRTVEWQAERMDRR